MATLRGLIVWFLYDAIKRRVGRFQNTKFGSQEGTHHSFFHFCFDIASKRKECLFHINACLCWCFNEFYAILNSQFLTTLFCYLFQSQTELNTQNWTLKFWHTFPWKYQFKWRKSTNLLNKKMFNTNLSLFIQFTFIS